MTGDDKTPGTPPELIEDEALDHAAGGIIAVLIGAKAQKPPEPVRTQIGGGQAGDPDQPIISGRLY